MPAPQRHAVSVASTAALGLPLDGFAAKTTCPARRCRSGGRLRRCSELLNRESVIEEHSSEPLDGGNLLDLSVRARVEERPLAEGQAGPGQLLRGAALRSRLRFAAVARLHQLPAGGRCSVTFLSAHEADSRHSRYVRHLQQLGVPVFQLPVDPVDELVLESRFDIALLTFWPVAELVAPDLPQALAGHPHRRRLGRPALPAGTRAGSCTTTGPDLPPFDVDYGTQLVGELNAYADADLVLTVSDKEARVLDDYLGDATPVRAVPDCEELEPSPVPMKERAGILFIGSFHHAPNVQAAEFLCREIVPRIDPKLLERHPVYIVGDGLNDTVRSFAEDNPHVRLVGWVPSVVPYLQRARVSILPLLYGAGTKRKLVQALMTGTPDGVHERRHRGPRPHPR